MVDAALIALSASMVSLLDLRSRRFRVVVAASLLHVTPRWSPWARRGRLQGCIRLQGKKMLGSLGSMRSAHTSELH